ncbi:MAG TPA: hypothetical protein DCQ31_03595 [Bacteroidales bacterium]|nr:hypothetical protein [Bacteroidales bacterium]
MIEAKDKILGLILEKSVMKQEVYDNTFYAFEELKEVVKDVCDNYNEELPEETDERVCLEYKDRGKFAIELKVAGDVLVFMMHTNVFDFDPEHPIRKHSYVKEAPLNSFCGVIFIYNFLADSFKYGRMEDLGYLVGRIMINRENHYFVEGKRQLGFLYNDIANDILTPLAIRNIVESAILYSIDFDLFLPPLKNIQPICVGAVEDVIRNSGVAQTGKRLGFKFYHDDDDNN